MAKTARERFNFWSAYVDLFSNLLALLLMVGLVAAASGGAVSGSQRVCAQVRNDDSDLTRKLHEFAVMSGLSDFDLEPGANCEISFLPANGDEDGGNWFAKSEFLRFPKGSATFCWLRDARGASDCGLGSIADDATQMTDWCNSLRGVLDSIVEHDRETGTRSGYRVVIIGHSSGDWVGNEVRACSQFKFDPSVDDEEAEIVCNYELSLKRAQSAFSYCRHHWPVTTDPDEQNRYNDVLTLAGDGSVDTRLGQAVGQPANVTAAELAGGGQQRWRREERRISVSVYAPNEGF